MQSSVSLRPSLWKRVDLVGDLTQWGRSGVVSQAVELLTALPLTVTQRLATLRRTTVNKTLEERLLSAIEEAVSAAETELPDGPWAEFDAALLGAREGFERSGAAEMSEEDLRAAADAAKREVRREKRARPPGTKSSRR